jgi:hypothetical protein
LHQPDQFTSNRPRAAPGDQTIASILGLLTSFEKNSREALNTNEPTKIVEQLNVNSRYNSIYKKMASTPVDIAVPNREKLGSKSA